MPRVTPAQAYPDIPFHRGTFRWLARFIRLPAECVHLKGEPSWMATFLPDTLFLCGKGAARRQPARPEVSLCRECLLGQLSKELAAYPGRMISFEPDGQSFTQYFFVAAQDLDAAGVEPAVAQAIGRRLGQDGGSCRVCSRPATWLWFSRDEVESLDKAGQIAEAVGGQFCAEHGAQHFCRALAAIEQANLFYVNVPYGDGGAYLWI